MAPKRGARGGGADLYASRQTEQITPSAEDELDPIEVIDAETGEPVEDDEPEDDAEQDPADDDGEEDPADPPADDALTTMQRQLAAMQAERDEAIRARDEATTDTVVTQQQVLQQALSGAKQRAVDAEAAIAAASEAGDHVGVAKATAALSKAIQDQDRFELAVDEIAVEIEDRKKPKPAATKQQPAGDADPYVASLSKFSDPSKEWLIKRRSHIEGNTKVGQKAQALALLAIADGIKEDSPEFFAYLDKGLGFEVKTKRTKPAPGRPQTAAPAGSRAGTGRPNEVILSPAEKQAARNLGMTLAEYGRSKLEIQKNGKDPARPGLRFSADTAHSSRR